MQNPTEQQLTMLGERRIASVATISPDGMPHLTSVWFLYENDEFLLAIPSSSAKGRNLRRDPRIAVMIDARENHRESGLTACGHAEIIEGERAAEVVQRVHEKYLTADALADPAVGPVFAGIDDIAIRVRPGRWISWDMSELDTHVFSGKLSASGYFKQVVP